MTKLRIVTRTSQLALWQANHIRSKLIDHHPKLDVEIIGIKTQGDLWLQTPLQKIGGKGLFVKELEQAILANEADVAVHSLKDIPAVFPSELGLVAICERENPFDAWICPNGFSVQTLPPGSKVGTSSLRRMAQLQQLRPDLHYAPLRGNVDSRLRKCEEGEWDAIVLAVAGLSRLGLMEKITSIFDPQHLLPAVGQGALGLECRLNDEHTQSLLSVLDHAPTRTCVESERAMNAALGGNCQVPVAGFAFHEGNKLSLTGRVGDMGRALILEAHRVGHPQTAIQLGEQVAQDLIEQGAQQIIKEIMQNG